MIRQQTELVALFGILSACASAGTESKRSDAKSSNTQQSGQAPAKADSSKASGDSSDDLAPLPQEFLGLTAVRCNEIDPHSPDVATVADVPADQALVGCIVTDASGKVKADVKNFKKNWEFFDATGQAVTSVAEDKAPGSLLNFLGTMPSAAAAALKIDCTVTGQGGATVVLTAGYKRQTVVTGAAVPLDFDLSCAAVQAKDLAVAAAALSGKVLVGCSVVPKGTPVPATSVSLVGLNPAWTVTDSTSTPLTVATMQPSLLAPWDAVLAITGTGTVKVRLMLTGVDSKSGELDASVVLP